MPVALFSPTYKKNIAPVRPVGVLKNIGASCYLDSVLVSLFADSIPFLDQKFLYRRLPSSAGKKYRQCNEDNKEDYRARRNIQLALREIVDSLRYSSTVDYCSNFRRAIRDCQGDQAFHQAGQQDAGEFITWLFSVFGIFKSTKKETIYRTKSTRNTGIHLNKMELYKSRYLYNDSAIHTIDNWTLQRYANSHPNGTSIHRLLINITDTGVIAQPINGYSRFITTIELISGKYAVLYLNRADPVSEEYIDYPIIPSQKLTLLNDTLSLHAIVCHSGGGISSGHYIAFVRAPIREHKSPAINYKRAWYFFDDLQGQFERTTWENIKNLNHGYNVNTNGILFFYR
jgi:uncharacterized UBP type Zn finger protein